MQKEISRSPEIYQPIKKLFIANRGEIAVRAASTCEKRGIHAVIPYSFPDTESLIARIAEEKGWTLAPIGGTTPRESYANPMKILEEAQFRNCDAIFLGYGFLAEDVSFIKRCEEEEIRVLAPSSKAMEQTGNKIAAREIARRIKIGPLSSIPILEGTGDLFAYNDVVKSAREIGFPVMLKDPDMGGGMGNLVVRNWEELEKAYEQLKARPGNEQVFLERYVQNAAHVEIQIAADKYGNAVALGDRDCTIQRTHQKLVEESPSPNISPRIRSAMQNVSIKFAKEVGYSGVGTWEYIVDLDKRGRHGEPTWYFMEVNPRIQVEHPVTEEQTGIDIVELMIDVAEGKRLPFKIVSQKGHTIEARVYAENPELGFKKDAGELEVLRYPEIEGVRIDRGYEEGNKIPGEYDGTICKVISHGENRSKAIEQLKEALTRIQIVGVSNNRSFLLELLNSEPFNSGTSTTMFVENWWNKKLREKATANSEFINGGTFILYPPSRILDAEKLPVNPAIKSANSDRVKTYSEYLAEQKRKTGKESASDYGIIEREGVQFVVYFLNYDFNAGTVGKAEAWTFEDACKLAYKKQLPLITITHTAGIRNYENSQSLLMMNDTVANLTSEYPPLFHIDVKTGNVYGGVPASYSGRADLFIAVNNGETRIGFTGPYAVAVSEGLRTETTDAKDAYKVLNDLTHTPTRHFQKRSDADILACNLPEASDIIVHLLHIIKKKHPQIATDPHISYKPKEQIGFTTSANPAARFDAPDVHLPGWIPHRLSELWDNLRHRKYENTIFIPNYQRLSIGERRRITGHPNRPTAVDLIDPNAGIFEDATLLSKGMRIGGVLQFPPIIAAVTTFEEKPIFILAQQTQKVTKKGETKVVYDPPKPSDWKYTKRMIRFAEKLGLPLILLGNTKGASCTRESEDCGQSMEIAGTLEAMYKYEYPVISINYGTKGSGGGAPFIWTADASAGFENATWWVADVPAMMNFLTKEPFINEETATEEQLKKLYSFMDQFQDAGSESQLRTFQIDRTLKEGQGGAHIDPRIVAWEMKEWLSETIPQLEKLQKEGSLKTNRRKRKERASYFASSPNPSYY